MKQLLLSISLVIGYSLVFAQQHPTDGMPENLRRETIAKVAVYGGKLAELREWIKTRTDEQAGKTTDTHVKFRWPMRVNSNYDDVPDYVTVSNYMDINRDLSNVDNKDWWCHTGLALNYRYHEGNDYSLFPFFWRMMNNKNAFACAAAPGVVLAVRDYIQNDDNCMRNDYENNNPNYISVLNGDSSISQYLHIKTGSARVIEGQFVQEGQLLANIASSGHSSNPHLHFDLQYFRLSNGDYNYVEPFKKSTDNDNSCNPFTATSWWKNQKNFVEPKLLRVMTHYGSPLLQGFINEFADNGLFCPDVEDPKVKNQFSPGESVCVGIALSHVSRKDSVHLRIIYPNGNFWTGSPVPVPNQYGSPVSGWFRAIYLTQTFALPSNAPEGTYTIETDFVYRPFDAGDTYYPETSPVIKSFKSYFTVGCTPSLTLSNTLTTEKGFIVSNDLNSSQVISVKALYQSANYIKLTPGFQAKEGSTFKARIRDCGFSD